MSDTDSPDPGTAPANPFVPRYREPWVNPAKKGAALAVAAASAVVLLALGFLLGLGLAGHGNRPGARHELRVMMRHQGLYGPPHGWTGYRPRGVVPQRHPARPVPVPSTSHS